MPSGEVHAWNILNRKPVIVRWDKGAITELTTTDKSPNQNKWIGPPLVDLQINGFAGIDFQKQRSKKVGCLNELYRNGAIQRYRFRALRLQVG